MYKFCFVLTQVTSVIVMHALATRCLCFVRNGGTSGLQRADTFTYPAVISLRVRQTASVMLGNTGNRYDCKITSASATLGSLSAAARTESPHMAYLQAAAALTQNVGRGIKAKEPIKVQ